MQWPWSGRLSTLSPSYFFSPPFPAAHICHDSTRYQQAIKSWAESRSNTGAHTHVRCCVCVKTTAVISHSATISLAWCPCSWLTEICQRLSTLCRRARRGPASVQLINSRWHSVVQKECYCNLITFLFSSNGVKDYRCRSYVSSAASLWH